MLLPYLAGIVIVPLKARTVGYFFHGDMYIMVIYLWSSARVTVLGLTLPIKLRALRAGLDCFVGIPHSSTAG